MLIDSSKICLLVVDIQERLIDSIFNSKKIITYTSRAIDIFTSLGIPVIFTEQYPKGLGPTVKELNEKLFQIGAKKIIKTTFSCCGSEEFQSYIKTLKKEQILVCGIETHICVLQTVFGLIDSKYNVFILEESTGSRKKQDKELAIKRIANKGVIFVQNQ